MVLFLFLSAFKKKYYFRVQLYHKTPCSSSHLLLCQPWLHLHVFVAAQQSQTSCGFECMCVGRAVGAGLTPAAGSQRAEGQVVSQSGAFPSAELRGELHPSSQPCVALC